MKKARKIVMPDEIPMKTRDFVKLREHAYNSSFWYASNYLCNSAKIREKLTAKGYLDKDLEVIDENGETLEYNFIQDAIDRLLELSVLDDYHFARRIAERKFSQGQGINRIRQELMIKGVDKDDIDRVIEEFSSTIESQQALEVALERALRSYTVTKETSDFLKKQKVLKALLSKGFSFESIKELVDEAFDG